jgi:hypothetical protein
MVVRFWMFEQQIDLSLAEPHWIPSIQTALDCISHPCISCLSLGSLEANSGLPPFAEEPSLYSHDDGPSALKDPCCK